ncbi:MAG: hypothetical protein II085_00610, partial [Alphaproteobacteria bacterium]|nr:hypothetical protein [Alphaproteobacteria bacterium]
GSVTLCIYDNITKRKYSTQPYKNGYSTNNTPFVEICTDKYIIRDTNKNKKVDKTDMITIIETGQEISLGEYLDSET